MSGWQQPTCCSVAESRPLAARTVVDHLLAGAGIEIAGGGLDAARFHGQVGVEAAPFVGELGVLDQSVDIVGIALAATAGVMKVLGYRVLATGAQWLAAQQPPAAQQAAAPRTKTRDRNPCIIRAIGVESATLSEQWA